MEPESQTKSSDWLSVYKTVCLVHYKQHFVQYCNIHTLQIVRWTRKLLIQCNDQAFYNGQASCLYVTLSKLRTALSIKSARHLAQDWHVFFLVMLQLVLVLIAVFAVVVYRAAVYAVLAAQNNYNMGAVSIATSGTAALINLIIIMLLNKVRELSCCNEWW